MSLSSELSSPFEATTAHDASLCLVLLVLLLPAENITTGQVLPPRLPVAQAATAQAMYTQDWRTSLQIICGSAEKEEDSTLTSTVHVFTCPVVIFSAGSSSTSSTKHNEASCAVVEPQEDEEEEDASNGEDSSDESDTNSNQEDEKEMEPRKPKRTRTAYSNYQLDQLELIFTSTQYPDVFTREELSRRLCIKEDRIQVMVSLHNQIHSN